MTHPPQSTGASHGHDISLLTVGSVLLRWRRVIVVLAAIGFGAGAAKGLLTTRLYKSSATFIPQHTEPSNSGLAAAVGQLGIRLPAGANAWGPPMYVEMLRSPTLLEPLANDTVDVAEESGRRIAVMDLFEIDGPTPALRLDRAVRVLRQRVRSREVTTLGGVEISVTSSWPSVSLQLANKLLDALNRFNVETRKSQAAAERHFAEEAAADAERALLAAEERMRDFLERNRSVTGSPDLSFRRDRLQREVDLRQALLTSLLQSKEEARIREVRDTPVITVLEAPRLPVVGESRGTVRKAILGLLAGMMVGVFAALAAHGLRSARSRDGDAREFFRLVEEATPRFLRRSVR